MGIIEILLISIGLSFDVFVVHICVGAGFSRKHGKDTLLSSLIFGGMQLFALILGNVVADILKPDRKMNETISTAASGWELLSVLIFIGLGIYMICKARNNKQIFERRNDEINWKRLRKLAVLTSVDAYFAGMGIGFWSVEILEQEWHCFRLRSFSAFLVWRSDIDWAVNITAKLTGSVGYYS